MKKESYKEYEFKIKQFSKQFEDRWIKNIENKISKQKSH